MKHGPCMKLDTKKAHIPELRDGAFREKIDAGYEGHFWCSCTGAEVGPDDRVVNLKNCSSPDRTCYRSLD